MQFKTVEDIRCFHRGLWFHRSNMQFFQTILLPTVYQGPGGIYFVTSEKGPSQIRAYTVRRYDAVADKVSTAGPFNAYSKASAAKNLAKLYASGKTQYEP